MSRLLTLEVGGDYKVTGARVPVSLRPLAGGAERQTFATVGSMTNIEVEAGRWQVEVVLPSGERLREVVDLSGETGSALSLAPEASPREWLGLQAMLVPSARHAGAPVATKSLAPPTPPEVYAVGEWRKACDAVRRAAGGGQALKVASAQRLGPKVKDDRFYLFEIPPAGNRIEGVVARMRNRVVVMPVARQWARSHGGPLVPTELVVDVAQCKLSAAIEDPDFTFVLGYLATGRSELAAQALSDIATDLLAEKIENPLAAAAGAYVLVDQLYDESRRAAWRSWIDNLATWFPDLPDGAILAGHLCRHEGDIAGACNAYLAAFDRGIPFFAAGLRMLVAGLVSFRESEVPPALKPRYEVARADVRRWATWLDPEGSFSALSPEISLETDMGSPTPLLVTA